MKIELFYNPTCPRCSLAKKLTKKVLKKYPQVEYEEVNAFERQDRVLELGFRTVPAIVIDGKLWFTGVPTKKELKSEIKRNLANPS
jgi:small redox-active disulfide protein 1